MLPHNNDLSRQLPALFPVISCLAVSLVLGLPALAQDSRYVVSTSQTWLDTGLDLQSGDLVQISATSSAGGCDPNGLSGAASNTNLPLPSAPVGALIALLHAQAATPLLVGSSHDLQIAEASHLFLGVNVAGDPRARESSR